MIPIVVMKILKNITTYQHNITAGHHLVKQHTNELRSGVKRIYPEVTHMILLSRQNPFFLLNC